MFGCCLWKEGRSGDGPDGSFPFSTAPSEERSTYAGYYADHVPSRDLMFAFRLDIISLSSVETTNDSCAEDYFMQRLQRVSASQRRDLDIGPAFEYQQSMLPVL